MRLGLQASRTLAHSFSAGESGNDAEAGINQIRLPAGNSARVRATIGLSLGQSHRRIFRYFRTVQNVIGPEDLTIEITSADGCIEIHRPFEGASPSSPFIHSCGNVEVKVADTPTTELPVAVVLGFSS